MFQKNWQELIKPQKLKTDVGHDGGRAATITADDYWFADQLGIVQPLNRHKKCIEI